MPHTPEKIVVQLTPPGRGAVATVRVEGDDAAAVVDQCFASRGGKTLAETPTNRTLVGHFHSPNSPASEEVVSRRCSQDAVEIHCHGGTASVARIIETFGESGYRPISWGEWVEKKVSGTFCAQHPPGRSGKRYLTPFFPEAYRDLARAQTELTAGLLLDQYHGALDRELEAIHECTDSTEKQRRATVLLERATWGIHLTRPWQIVLSGSPNVGKSSLMNRLLGYDRAITDATPGTTRDLVRAQTVFGGWPVELIDTAGLREGDHPVEQLGVQLALDQLQSADLVLVLLDATREPTEEELRIIKEIGDRGQEIGVLVVRSKVDLVEEREKGTGTSCLQGGTAFCPQEGKRSQSPFLSTSAASGEGVEQLIAAIETRLFPTLPEPGAAIPWTERQVEAIRQIL